MECVNSAQNNLADNDPLVNQRIAITGRLACLTRVEAASLIENLGGQFCRNVSRATSMVVVGQHGLPLGSSGRLTRDLERARMCQRRGCALEIVGEEQFLQRIGVYDALVSSPRVFSLGDVIRMIGGSRDRIRALIDARVIEPVETRRGIPFFDFRDVTRMRSLMGLLDAGARPLNVARSLRRLRHLVPAVDQSSPALQILESWGARVVVRTSDGSLLESTGQRLFDFDVSDSGHSLRVEEDLFQKALHCEDQQDLEGAAAAYEQLLADEGPDAEICFQLGNILCGLQSIHAAIQRFRQTIELERDYAEAWNNLACLLAEAGNLHDAVDAYRQAVALDPTWSDARFGLADVLEETGNTAEAKTHWKVLLDLDADEEYTRYARQRLSDHSCS